jgi:hypothetical protein
MPLGVQLAFSKGCPGPKPGRGTQAEGMSLS